MPVFPSVEWFEAVKKIVNEDEAFRRLGTVDTKVGVKVGAKVYELDFEAFECLGAKEIAEDELRDVDFWLESDAAGWKELLTNIKENGGADRDLATPRHKTEKARLTLRRRMRLRRKPGLHLIRGRRRSRPERRALTARPAGVAYLAIADEAHPQTFHVRAHAPIPEELVVAGGARRVLGQRRGA